MMNIEMFIKSLFDKKGFKANLVLFYNNDEDGWFAKIVNGIFLQVMTAKVFFLKQMDIAMLKALFLH